MKKITRKRKKKCTICGESKLLTYFNKVINRNGTKAKYCSSECKKCFNKKRREGEWRRSSSRRRKYYLENREKSKNKELIKTYGITLKEFNEMRKRQDYLCLICEKHESDSNKGLHIDHCHESNKVRGLLCNSCNLAIGQLKHNVTIMNKAIKYLLGQ